MADNTTLNSGTGGDVIATDDIGGVKYQRVKETYGVDGSATDVSDTNPLPITATGGRSTLNGSTSQSVKASAGRLTGIFVASSTSGTIKLWDNTAASGTVLVNTFSATAATWYPLPFAFGTGLYITVGGTIDYTVSYT
jgi:hypothetical protein